MYGYQSHVVNTMKLRCHIVNLLKPDIRQIKQCQLLINILVELRQKDTDRPV